MKGRRGGGVVDELMRLRAESTESLLLLVASLLLFPLTAAAALVGAAPKLGPTVFTPLSNTELAVLPLLTVGRWTVEGDPNPKILRFFCATLNTLRLQPTKRKTRQAPAHPLDPD